VTTISPNPDVQTRERSRTRTAAVIFGLVVLAAAGGWALLIDAGRKMPVREATVDGIEMHMLEARWVLDQMDHGDNFQKPTTMMPGMPEYGNQRVTLSLQLTNRAAESRMFRGEEFQLLPEFGESLPPIGAQIGQAVLLPGQTLNTALHFDLDTRKPHGKLRAVWRHGEEVVYLPIPEPAVHAHLLPRGLATPLPGDARLLLPIGKQDNGKQLYEQVYGCIACHGAIGTPGTNNVGPHLAAIGLKARERIEGTSAAQYIYDSILEPNAFIAPACRDELPCEQPSAMPEYGNLVSLQDVADLVTYLLHEQTLEVSQ